MHILIFAPHPDDDVIGCGGSIAKHRRAEHSVSIYYMTSGESGSSKIPKADLASCREREAQAAAFIFAIPDVRSGPAVEHDRSSRLFFARFPDGYLNATPAILALVTTTIRLERPDVVYIPHEQDAHSDHAATHRIVREAIVRAAGPWFQECSGDPWSVPTVLCYEVWTPLQEVSYVEDITDVIDVKLAALRRHESQLAGIAYDDAVAGLNRYRGAMTGRGKYCECFQVLRMGNAVTR